jgi:hypothetical protein
MSDKKVLPVLIRVLVLVALVSQVPVNSGWAQQSQPGKPFGKSKCVEMKSMPDLPNLPRYPGRASLLRSSYNPGAPGGGSVYALYLLVQDDVPAILSWYRDALEASKWDLNARSSSSRLLEASRPGIRCQIYVVPYGSVQHKSAVYITYRTKQD